MNVVKVTSKKGRQKIEEDKFLRFGEGSFSLIAVCLESKESAILPANASFAA